MGTLGTYFKKRTKMNSCVVGLQWGDEGKGKVVDILAEQSDIVVRYGGGANAGHTVVIGDSRFALHLLPSGSIRPDIICVIANGVVVDLEVLTNGIKTLAEKDISLDGRLFISENVHVVLDYHKKEDQLREESLGKNKLGTTIRGIGPCYADKVGRSYAVRMADLRDLKALKAKLQTIVEYKNKVFGAYSTRVGAGPFPTEQDNQTGQFIRDKGNEYGTTTGRPRRCGWFDVVAVSYAVTIGAIDSVAMMHLDTLAGLKELKICKAYKIDGQEKTFFPANTDKLSRASAVYETVPGWDEEITEVNDFNDLPANAQNYVCRIEEYIGKPITVIGVGPKRSQTLFR